MSKETRASHAIPAPNGLFLYVWAPLNTKELSPDFSKSNCAALAFSSQKPIFAALPHVSMTKIVSTIWFLVSVVKTGW